MSFTVTLRNLIVACIWIGGIALAVFDAFHGLDLAALSIALMVVAATASVRSCIDKYAANWEAAYGAGREVARVRQLRR